MYTAIHPDYLNQESIRSALDRKGARGFSFAYSDENKPGRETVGKDVGLSE